MAQATVGGERLRGQRVVRFGAFELYLDTGELRKHGVRVKLQGKPFHILSALIEEPGHVVTREELRNRLWPADTFVDFESGLNTAVNRLRITLADSAENPIYIETLARLGYRFIAPVIVSSATQRSQAIRSPQPELEPAVTAPEIGVAVSATTANRRFSLPTPTWIGIGSLVILAMAVAAAAVFFPISRSNQAPSFHQVTFRKGSVANARFTPDGGNIIYSAEWNGGASRVFLADLVSPEARDLGFENSWLASLSPAGEMAVFIRPKDSHKRLLERVPLRGGAPRLISDRASEADWAPDGTLCVVTDNNAIWSVEFPSGHKIYSSNGWITNPRVSPRGNEVAFLDHPVIGDDAGQVVVVNSSGEAHVLSSGWASALGLAWHPSAREVWFTAARSGSNRALMAVELRGHVRQVAEVPGDLQLKDIAASGKVLIAHTTQHVTMFLGNLNEKSERDISWLDWSRAVAITPDGKGVLFDESGEGGGKQYSVYLYRTDTRSPVRLGEGRAMDLSADGQWALTQSASDDTQLSLVSVNVGQPKPISGHGLGYQWAKFLPNAKEILVAGRYPKQSPGIYRQHLPDGSPILLKPGLNFENAIIDEKGHIAVGCDGFHIVVLELSNGNARFVKTPECVSPMAFVDAQTVLTRHQDGGSIQLDLLNLTTGKVTPYRRYVPPDLAGSSYTLPLHVAKDLQTFVYSRMQSLSNLFVVSGWK
jgi:DNA-binding winged helix-turn-helix (wHTH) protein/Tol biopolymer transport system component